jgi:hypothetical protein
MKDEWGIPAVREPAGRKIRVEIRERNLLVDEGGFDGDKWIWREMSHCTAWYLVESNPA